MWLVVIITLLFIYLSIYFYSNKGLFILIRSKKRTKSFSSLFNSRKTKINGSFFTFYCLFTGKNTRITSKKHLFNSFFEHFSPKSFIHLPFMRAQYEFRRFGQKCANLSIKSLLFVRSLAKAIWSKKTAKIK